MEAMAIVQTPMSKKSRTDEIMSYQYQQDKALMEKGPPRTSTLSAPIMLLTGHEGDIFTAKFSPNGRNIASSGFDRQILLWNVYGECENYAVMSGHTGAVMELHYSTDGSNLFTASTDKTLAIWDIEAGVKIKRLKGHQTFVNTCCPTRRGPQLLCSGSDDGTIKIWDPRQKGCAQTLQNNYQVTAVIFSDTSEMVISGGIDNDVKIWDLRKNEMWLDMRGHSDTVTGLALSEDGSYVLSNAMDNTLRIWDIRPYAPQERCVKVLQGHQHTFEKNLLRCSWSPDGSKVAAGSGDRYVYVWNTTNRRIMYKLPGHSGSVNEIAWHPTEPIVMSCSSDKQIFLGEIDYS